MQPIDIGIIVVYMLGVLGVGFFFYRRQSAVEEYFVGDRKMGAGHLGLSVVATDVGAGFSIGLGGLGFTMGISGSWLLFTGLIGAWMAAVILIPRVKPLGDRLGWRTFPDFLEHRFGPRTRLVAAILSAVGYAAFVGAQVNAGAKISAGAFQLDMNTSLWLMGSVVVLYTAFGGLQAVVFTDTIQWIVLFAGLAIFALPAAWAAAGGLDGVHAALGPEFLSLTNVTWRQIAEWSLAIIPIWFVGMTLYQRIYAARDVKTAKRAWYLAGLLEWPGMAFLGAVLGMLAHVIFPLETNEEMGLPRLIAEILPTGIAGLTVAAYFSAIMSTADSCLLASVGNLVGDIYERHLAPGASERRVLFLSRVLTLVVGFGSIGLAMAVPRVLDGVMLAYTIMVSGLFFPTLAGVLWRRPSGIAAFWSMVAGGATVVALEIAPAWAPWGISVLGAMPVSAAVLVVLTIAFPTREAA